MVRPIGHIKFVCKKCGWFESIHLKSDVIYGRPDVCPKCAFTEFEVKNDSLLSNVSGIFKKEQRK